ncbi:MAG: hypothetical protein U0235_08365 [Polyangiaceae bacterium]
MGGAQVGRPHRRQEGQEERLLGRIIWIEKASRPSPSSRPSSSTTRGQARSAAGCTIRSPRSIGEYLRSNVVLYPLDDRAGLRGQGRARAPAKKMEEWLEKPVLLQADADAEYAEIIEIDLDQIRAAPRVPQRSRRHQQLSEVAGTKVGEISSARA